MSLSLHDLIGQGVKNRRLQALNGTDTAYNQGVINVVETNNIEDENTNYLPHNPVIIEEDVFNIDDYKTGNIITKKDALVINEGDVDLPVSYSEIESKIDGFYNMPVMDVNSDDSREILYSVFEEFSNEEKERYVVNTEKREEAYIVDVDTGIPTQIYFSPQLRLDCDLREKESKTGKTLEENINNILNEIKPRV